MTGATVARLRAALGMNPVQMADLLGVEKDMVPGRVTELFSKWKKARKAVKKKKPLTKDDVTLTSTGKFPGTDDEILEEAAKILKTQQQFVSNTVSRFLKELEEMGKEAK